MEIARRNIFDEIIGRASSVYESAILTCFSFDPLYFIQYYLPKLNSINVTNIIVLIDAGQYDEACEELIKYRESTGRNIQLNFSPVRIVPTFHGVFHPKIALLVGPKQCTALVGSGNLTYGGMTYNNEIWNAFSANNAEAEEAPIIASIWRYLSSIVASAQNTISEQLNWMTVYSDSLKAIAALSDTTSLGFFFLVNTPERGIGEQLLTHIGNETVKDIAVVSPYFDSDGAALTFLTDRLNPTSVLCLGDDVAGTLPFALSDDRIKLFDFRSISGEDMEARTHAKIIQIHTEESTFLLSGSANVTKAGLGIGAIKNDEATVLIHHQGYKDYIAEMGIVAGDTLNLSPNPGSKSRDVKPENKEVSILSCELWNGEYIISTSKALSHVDLLWKTLSGDEGEPIHFVNIEKVERIKYDDLPGAASIVLSRDGVPISNRVFVLVDNVIRNFCPDKAMKQLSRLMDVSKGQDWDSNITQILSFVTFEEEVLQKTGKHHIARKRSSSQVPDDTIIDREDFAASPLESDAARRNNRVLEYFFRFISSEEDESEEIEEVYSLADIDKGNAEGDEDSNAKKTKVKTSCKQKLSELDDYLNRLVRHYDLLCKRFDSAEQPFFLDEKTDIQRTAQSKAYSSCLISIVLLYQLTKDNESTQDKVEESHLYRRLLTLLGRFLLIYRDMTVDGDGYLTNKMREMKQNLFVHSMTLMSHFTWEYGTSSLSTILVLNLLDMYKGSPEALKAAIQLYEDNLTDAPIYINPDSLSSVKKCISLYYGGESVAQNIDETDFPIIIYKKRLGFLICKEAKRSKTPKSNSLEYTVSVASSGFKDFTPVVFHNAKKIPVFKSKSDGLE